MKFFPLHSEYIAQWHFASVFSHVNVSCTKMKSIHCPRKCSYAWFQSAALHLSPTHWKLQPYDFSPHNLNGNASFKGQSNPERLATVRKRWWSGGGIYDKKKKRSLIFSWRNWIRRAFTPWCAIPSRNNPGIFPR